MHINKQIFWRMNNSSPFNWLFKTKAQVSVISINPPHVRSPPVSMSCCQAVGVHVSLRRSGDAITIHGSHHGVCSSLQQQAHQFKVTWSLNNSFLKRKKKKRGWIFLSPVDSQVLRHLWSQSAGQLQLCTCGSRQLQRRLCVVLHPVLERALHVGFGIQQQLQWQTGAWWEGEKGDSLNNFDVL